MKKSLLLSLVLLLSTGIISTGCLSGPPSAQSGTAGPSQIVLGAVVPLSGEAASFGQGTFGLQAAVDDINNKGGVLVKQYNTRIPLKLEMLDTLGEFLILHNNINFLVSSPVWPQDVAAIATVAEKYKIPFLAHPGALEPNMAIREAAGGWKYTWESGFSLVTPAPAGDFRAGLPLYTMADLWMCHLNKCGGQTNRKVAIYSANDSDSTAWYRVFSSTLKQAGFTPIGSDQELGLVQAGTTDFTSIIKEWMDNGAEILMGSAPSNFIGTLLGQCAALGFKPKVVIAERGGMLYDDILSWGGNLPNGVMSLVEWSPASQNVMGIGHHTPRSLNDRWARATGKPFQPMVGDGYSQIQVLVDAIQRAGTLDKDKVNAALARTDLVTMRGRVKYDARQFSRMPIAYGQWFKAPDPIKWQMKIVYAGEDFAIESQPSFPIPY